QALEAYTAARAKVQEPRNVWERLGLLGRDPTDTLDDGAGAFGRGDFQTAVNKAHDAASAVDGASRSAFIRLTIAIGVLAGLSVAAAAALWISRGRRSAGAPYP
ncbi:MAG TPA: hypothetical protein VFT91_03975, partial [Dehalococcoidia bacterium]|nr:hypothetical protein [Dehalococcoidia bacterium]